MTPSEVYKHLKNKIPIPEHTTILGDVDLNICIGDIILPDYLTIEGCLNLTYQPNIYNLPKKLYIFNNLYLSGCKNIKEIPGDLRVLGVISLSRYQSLIIPSTIKRNTTIIIGKYIIYPGTKFSIPLQDVVNILNTFYEPLSYIYITVDDKYIKALIDKII